MATLINNKIIIQLRVLLRAALNLKEGYDKSKSLLDLNLLNAIYQKELLKLSMLATENVINAGNLLRHSSWIDKYIFEKKPENCYKDICDVCFIDIFIVEDKYFKNLINTNNPTEKFYEWHNIHPVIRKIAKPRFESLHFADSVEASFKEINDIIKKKYKAKSKVEIDGNDLMRKAFSSSENNTFTPVFKLADNTSKSGRNIQQGYMDIFAGAMMGIRNPKTHANLNIPHSEAWEMIVLASHLMRMWEKYN